MYGLLPKSVRMGASRDARRLPGVCLGGRPVEILGERLPQPGGAVVQVLGRARQAGALVRDLRDEMAPAQRRGHAVYRQQPRRVLLETLDRKSTRLNSSH